MKRLTFFLSTTLFLVFLFFPAFAEPFSDVPENHWTYDSLKLLEEKGLLEGYPDGFFNGNRPATRYEMAMAVARIIAKLEQLEASVPGPLDLSGYATKDDIKIIDNLIKEYREELASLGVRVKNLEDTMNSLNSRVKELERVKVSGNFTTFAIGLGYSPGEGNGQSFGNPYPVSANPTPGPAIIYDRDRFNGPNGGTQLFQGSAIESLFELNVSAKIADKIRAGGTLTAYSGFGENGLLDQFGIVPPYNSMGKISSKTGFMTGGTLWFDTDGDWKINGRFGDYNLRKVSTNLFYGLRNNMSFAGKEVMPMNGIDLCGNLYKAVDIEVFFARNINVLRSSDSTGVPKAFRYELATPYNDGAGAYRNFSYGVASPGQYDNYLQGLWLGRDFCEKRFHIEGTFLKLYENYASNPSLGVDKNLTAPPKDALYYGFKGHYAWPEEKVKIYGEFNQTRFDYNLLDDKSGYTGMFLNVGAKVKLSPVNFYGEFFRISPNYDPFNYHMAWERIYADNNHDGWGWNYGETMTNSRRFSRTRPNRNVIAGGLNWKFGPDDRALIYADLMWMSQVQPTMITNDENSFQNYNFLTGNPVADKIGINIYGNQDHMFTVNDPAKGKEYSIEFGGKYGFDKTFLWGYFERHNFSRNYTTKTFAMDLNYTFVSGGITRDITDKFSAQGAINYVRCSGFNESGNDVKWSQIIPTCALKYNFSENTDFLIAYTFYSYKSETPYDVYDSVPDPSGSNDYHANRVITRLRVKF